MTTGSYHEVQGQPVVRFERTFPHPVQAVWEAITDPRRLQAWFPTSVEYADLSAGTPIAFRFAEDRYPPMTGQIVAVVAPERFEFTWGDDRLTFELDERDAGAACRLALSVVLDSAEKAARDAAGWDQCLDGLAVVIGGQSPERSMPSDSWREYYEEYQRLGLPASAPILN